MRDAEKITSRNNERLTVYRKIRDGKLRDRIFLEGVRLAEEGLRSELENLECLTSSSLVKSSRGSDLLKTIESRQIRSIEVEESVFKSIADTTNSQGIVMIAARPNSGRQAIERSSGEPNAGHILFLQEINDPSNLGAIMRTAEAAGTAGVILSERSTDAFSPKALRAGMGANLRLPIWENADFDECVGWAMEHNLRTVAADIRGVEVYTDLDWTVRTLIVFGSEAHGLNNRMLERLDKVVKIPMSRGVESLNLAASVAVLLFESVRQNS